jgi:hypothetical protein
MRRYTCVMPVGVSCCACACSMSFSDGSCDALTKADAMCVMSAQTHSSVHTCIQLQQSSPLDERGDKMRPVSDSLRTALLIWQTDVLRCLADIYSCSWWFLYLCLLRVWCGWLNDYSQLRVCKGLAAAVHTDCSRSHLWKSRFFEVHAYNLSASAVFWGAGCSTG